MLIFCLCVPYSLELYETPVLNNTIPEIKEPVLTFADELKNITQTDTTIPKYRNWRSATEFVNYENSELAALICKYFNTPEEWIYYVQTIPYLHEASEYWQTPLETVISHTGDCEDCSLLINFGLRSMGYDAGIALFNNHAIAVIAGNYTGKYFIYNQKEYYVIESGTTYPIGTVMPSYMDMPAQVYI